MPGARTRTTASLIQNAIEAFQKAGMDVGAVEVEAGGVVRILPTGAIPAQRDAKGASGENSCDSLFEESD